MKFDEMNPIQRRLHNAACVLEADGDDYGFAQLQRDAIDEIERLRAALQTISKAARTGAGARGMAFAALQPIPVMLETSAEVLCPPKGAAASLGA